MHSTVATQRPSICPHKIAQLTGIPQAAPDQRLHTVSCERVRTRLDPNLKATDLAAAYILALPIKETDA